MMGANNPFWGKRHTPQVLERIEATKRARPPQRKGGPPKGYKHTPEARTKITAALIDRWKNNRDRMLLNMKRGDDHPLRKLNSELRYRRNFTRYQKHCWIGHQCAWCQAAENLVLDHIIPVMAGGKNEQTNAQTLCQPCNIWKMRYVDRPFYLASLGSGGG